ncbi:hypothetical protein D3C85_706340 [compost metagenome]
MIFWRYDHGCFRRFFYDERMDPTPVGLGSTTLLFDLKVIRAGSQRRHDGELQNPLSIRRT